MGIFDSIFGKGTNTSTSSQQGTGTTQSVMQSQLNPGIKSGIKQATNLINEQPQFVGPNQGQFGALEQLRGADLSGDRAGTAANSLEAMLAGGGVNPFQQRSADLTESTISQDPSQLTGSQQTILDMIKRNSMSDTLGGSAGAGLVGAGRGLSSTVLDLINRGQFEAEAGFRNDALSDNIARNQQGAGALAALGGQVGGQNLSAAGTLAGLDPAERENALAQGTNTFQLAELERALRQEQETGQQTLDAQRLGISGGLLDAFGRSAGTRTEQSGTGTATQETPSLFSNILSGLSGGFGKALAGGFG